MVGTLKHGNLKCRESYIGGDLPRLGIKQNTSRIAYHYARELLAQP